MEPLDTSTINAKKSVDAQNLMEQSLSVKDGSLVPDNASQDVNNVDTSRHTSYQLGTLDGIGDCNVVDQTIVSIPQTQPVVERDYKNAAGDLEDYSSYINIESMEAGSTGVYNENPSLMFHTSYGYSPHPPPPYGPYSPVTTPLPSANGGDTRSTHLYSQQQLPFPGHPYYQQSPPLSMPYLTSPTSVSQPLAIPVEHQGSFLADNSNSNGILFGPRPDHPLPYTNFGTGNFTGNSGLYDLRQGYDGFGSGGGFWSDWLKSPDGADWTMSPPLSSPAASPQPVGAFRSHGKGAADPLSSRVAIQQQNSLYGFGSSLGSYERGYFHGGMYHHGSSFGGTNGQSLTGIDKGRRRGKGNATLCNCHGPLDFLNEQNRGPRATRPKNEDIGQNFPGDSKNSNSTAWSDRELYNRADFPIDYKDAKFFIIKSYSEDNVHKSIKYGVWASTANGNRKLDSAHHEAKERGESCPVFLFFSVNASAQFCGVAEMVGPVDFDKSVDFWQQDKWSGQFPVKWHIIKDVPNNLFRHIILDNNDNKPVTNSRDTQEVKLNQGVEMLSIFKKHEADLSILDDFHFYEEREKAMQERKARQQQQLQSNSTGPVVVDSAPNKAVDVASQISKTFAQAVRLEENEPIAAAAAAKPEDPSLQVTPSS